MRQVAGGRSVRTLVLRNNENSILDLTCWGANADLAVERNARMTFVNLQVISSNDVTKLESTMSTRVEVSKFMTL